ncbi:MAG: hypothetical protein HQM10_26770 [Candidatus Riflebacteria bacterium]|nr:hypothetical protein [Candidatus Riflebacteria bacterium]
MLMNRSQVLLAKTEVVEGTDPIPTAAGNAVACADVTPGYSFEQLQRLVVNSDISDVKTLIGQEIMDMTIRCELKGSGTNDLPPEIAPLLKACGLTETVNDDANVQYAPTASTGTFSTATIYLYKGGLLWKANACKGNFTITENAGGYADISFQITGKFGGVSDAAVPSDAVYQTTIPVEVGSIGFSFGSFNDAVIRGFTISSENSVQKRLDVNSAKGLKGWFIAARSPKFSARIEAELEATHPFWANMRARTEEALDATLGTSAGNIVTVTAPKACADAIEVLDDSGILAYTISGKLLKNSGDDNYLIQFS